MSIPNLPISPTAHPGGGCDNKFNFRFIGGLSATPPLKQLSPFIHQPGQIAPLTSTGIPSGWIVLPDKAWVLDHSTPPSQQGGAWTSSSVFHAFDPRGASIRVSLRYRTDGRTYLTTERSIQNLSQYIEFLVQIAGDYCPPGPCRGGPSCNPDGSLLLPAGHAHAPRFRSAPLAVTVPPMGTKNFIVTATAQ